MLLGAAVELFGATETVFLVKLSMTKVYGYTKFWLVIASAIINVQYCMVTTQAQRTIYDETPSRGLESNIPVVKSQAPLVHFIRYPRFSSPYPSVPGQIDASQSQAFPSHSCQRHFVKVWPNSHRQLVISVALFPCLNVKQLDPLLPYLNCISPSY